jgi:hypothetical protein
VIRIHSGYLVYKHHNTTEYFKRTHIIEPNKCVDENNVKIIKKMPKKQITIKTTSNKIVRVRKTINPSGFIGPDKKRLVGATCSRNSQRGPKFKVTLTVKWYEGN